MTIFDRSNGNGSIVELPVDEIVDLLQVSHAPEVIAQFRERMQAGDRFPPVGVIRLAGRWVLTDGHKRLGAVKGLSVDRIPVEIWTWRRLLRDQRRQARANLDKNRRILSSLRHDPAASRELVASTVRHWKRVSINLYRWMRRGRDEL